MTIENTATTIPVTSAREAAAQGGAEYVALLAMLDALAPDDWSKPTDCPSWTVAEVVAHVNGAAEEAVRRRVQLRHLILARTRYRHLAPVDSLSAQQVADRKRRTPEELVTELRWLASRAPSARSSTPGFLRSRALPADSGCLPGDTLGYLLDVVYNRDLWMHRIDIARATGCPLVNSDAEPAIVAQVVRDLSRGWRTAPFTLILTGRVEGGWRIGDGTDDAGEITVDTVALCRLLSGRSEELQPTYRGEHPDLVEALRQSRILF